MRPVFASAIIIEKQAKSRGWAVSRQPRSLVRVDERTWMLRGLVRMDDGSPVPDKIIRHSVGGGWLWSNAVTP